MIPNPEAQGGEGGSWKDNATFIRSDMRDTELQHKGRSWIGSAACAPR